MPSETDEKYERIKSERQKYLDAILASPAQKKIVVAGPGTGKTYLFKQILVGKKNSLTLTFVNSLVEDLSLELCGLSTVKTLHAFARAVLNRGAVYPKLSKIIREDALLLLGEDVNFDRIFYDRADDNEHIPFYGRRLKYYKHYGYTDIIFAAVRKLEKEREKIPTYDQVLVDEFQDFNKLEVSLIDLLGEKSPILIVGDDDQALYDFKLASAVHIRDRHGEQFPEFESFTLPYCSRCTRVIVAAINDVLKEAADRTFLQNRIIKQYLYFDDKDKDKDCARFPKIPYVQIFSRQIPWFIESKILEIAAELKSKFSVLIISPTKGQCRALASALEDKGFRNIAFVDKDDDETPTLKEGLKHLMSDFDSNLGWRIVLKELLDANEFKAILAKSDEERPKEFIDLVGGSTKKEVRKLLASFRKIKNDLPIEDDDCENFFDAIEYKPRDITKQKIRDELASEERAYGDAAIRNIPIKITTVQSSKGLADDFVFIANFDDTYWVKDSKRVTDHEICNFLVALTRAKRKAFLISSQKKDPTFLQWIDKERIERLEL